LPGENARGAGLIEVVEGKEGTGFITHCPVTTKEGSSIVLLPEGAAGSR
jgi:hypothetical protein